MMPFKQYKQNCLDCGIPRNDSFRGNRCHLHYKEYQKNYYREKKKMLLDKQTEKRHNQYLEKDPTWVPRKERPKQTKEERAFKKKLYEQSETVMVRKKFLYNFKRYVGNPPLRKPVRKNPDRELYTDNATWGTDHTMYLNLDAIRYCPMEELTIEHWVKKQEELDEYVKQQRQMQNGYVSGVVDNSYTKKDLKYGELTKNGNIRLYPT